MTPVFADAFYYLALMNLKNGDHHFEQAGFHTLFP